LRDGSDRLADSLKCEFVKQLLCLNISTITSFSNSNRFSQTQTAISYVLCSLQYYKFYMYNKLKVLYVLQSTNVWSRKFITNKEESR